MGQNVLWKTFVRPDYWRILPSREAGPDEYAKRARARAIEDDRYWAVGFRIKIGKG
jgi:hypothetical protein